MFEDIGNKIKKLAKIITWVGIIASVVLGIMIWSKSFIWGLVFMIVGALLSWISSFLLYGIGELIENTAHLNEIVNDTRVYTKSIYDSMQEQKREEELKKVIEANKKDQ